MCYGWQKGILRACFCIWNQIVVSINWLFSNHTYDIYYYFMILIACFFYGFVFTCFFFFYLYDLLRLFIHWFNFSLISLSLEFSYNFCIFTIQDSSLHFPNGTLLINYCIFFFLLKLFSSKQINNIT